MSAARPTKVEREETAWREQLRLEEQRRIDRQRTLFNVLPTCSQRDKLKNAMLQRAYDLMWDGEAEACDALIEFLPSDDVGRMLDAWLEDQDAPEARRSCWYRSQYAV
jgi:hypothetical protein